MSRIAAIKSAHNFVTNHSLHFMFRFISEELKLKNFNVLSDVTIGIENRKWEKEAWSKFERKSLKLSLQTRVGRISDGREASRLDYCRGRERTQRRGNSTTTERRVSRQGEWSLFKICVNQTRLGNFIVESIFLAMLSIFKRMFNIWAAKPT